MITCMRIFHCKAIFCWAVPSRWRRILQIPRAASCLPDLLSCLQDLLGRTFYSGFTQAAPPQAARVCMTCLPGSKTPVKISSPIFYHCPCKMNKGSPAGPNHLFFLHCQMPRFKHSCCRFYCDKCLCTFQLFFKNNSAT